MRARFIIFACMALAVTPCLATDPPAPKPVVILPVAPMPSPAPQPMPGPPATVTKLEKGARYVVRASKQCDMVISPEGLVEVEEKKGPRDWTAIFAGGTGDYEDRHYDDPFLYSVKAIGTGTVKVTFIPRGYTTPKEWVEATIEANNGSQPPPGPTPKPPDPAPVPVTSFRVIFVYETANPLTPSMQQAMGSEAVRNYLDTKTTGKAGVGKGWRKFDKDVDVTNERDENMKALWQAARPKVTTVPCVVIEVNGKADIVPFPASEAESLALFKKYAEGK